MGVGLRGRGLRAVLAGSLVFGTVVVGSVIVGEVPASATPPDRQLQYGWQLADRHHCRCARLDDRRSRDLHRELHHRREPGPARFGHPERDRIQRAGVDHQQRDRLCEQLDDQERRQHLRQPRQLRRRHSQLRHADPHQQHRVEQHRLLRHWRHLQRLRHDADPHHSTVSGNTAYEGGGILAEGTTTLTNSTVSGNTADYGGGVRTCRAP